MSIFLTGCGGSGSGSSSTSEESFVANAESVSLSWLAPGQRVNGDQISYTSEIDGYIVLYGQDPAVLDQQATVDCNALNCSYDIKGLEDGTWYFAVQTVDNNGLVSAASQPVSRNI
jgi:hypothetical protein